MSVYKVQLKQGSRTLVEYIEASSVSDVQAFYSTVTTMKLTEVLKVEYQASDNSIPIDDFNYNRLYKAFIKDTSTGKSRQVILHHLKKSLNENEIADYIKAYMKIDGVAVDSVYCSLMKL